MFYATMWKQNNCVKNQLISVFYLNLFDPLQFIWIIQMAALTGHSKMSCFAACFKYFLTIREFLLWFWPKSLYWPRQWFKIGSINIVVKIYKKKNQREANQDSQIQIKCPRFFTSDVQGIFVAETEKFDSQWVMEHRLRWRCVEAKPQMLGISLVMTSELNFQLERLSGSLDLYYWKFEV